MNGKSDLKAADVPPLPTRSQVPDDRVADVLERRARADLLDDEVDVRAAVVRARARVDPPGRVGLSVEHVIVEEDVVTVASQPDVDLDPLGAIALVPSIMQPFRTFSPRNSPESPSREGSSLASMLDTPGTRDRSSGPPADRRPIDLPPVSRSSPTVSAVG